MLEPCLSTYTGGKLYPMGPDPEDIELEDIAHALSHQCRYTGHTSSFWSVAAHSIEVAHRAFYRAIARGSTYREASHIALCGLMHDASEAYLVDIPKPIKPLFVGYNQWEAHLSQAVATRFGLTYPWPSIVEEIDHEIPVDEIKQFFPPDSYAWQRRGVTHDTVAVPLIVRPIPETKQVFLRTFAEFERSFLRTEVNR
jgi:uncharacterized protein